MHKNPILEKYPNVRHWLALQGQDRILVFSGKVEIGQRISTALVLIVAGELDVPFDQIEIKSPETGLSPDEGLTAGSMSMSQSGDAVRLAAATLRKHLLQKASSEFEVSLEDLQVKNGIITTADNAHSISYWSLMEGQSLDVLVDVALNSQKPKGQEQISRSFTACNIKEIVTGKFLFVHDLELPGMLHARIIRPPQYHTSLKILDKQLISKLKEHHLEFIQNGSFLAVAGQDEYAVIKASEKIKQNAKWTIQKKLNTNNVFESLTTNIKTSLPVQRGGLPSDEKLDPLKDPPKDAEFSISARYEKPYLLHGSIGPSAACALFREGILTVWTHSQGIYPLRDSLAIGFEIEPGKIKIHHVPGAGCYGHNGADDAAFEAALIAMELPDIPVLLKWTREEEHSWEPYGTAMVCKLRGSLDPKAKIIDWSHESFGDTFMNRANPNMEINPASKFVSSHYLKNRLAWPVSKPNFGPHEGIHRNLDPYYNFQNCRLVKNLVKDLPLRTSSLRSLGAFMNVFSIETFMDEMAKKGGVDPISLRLNHLKDDRAAKVISVVHEKMNTDQARSDDFYGNGIAFARYKNIAAYCAVGIELEVQESASIRLNRAWIAADAGEIVDSDGVIFQLEGGLIQAASWTLYEKVTFDEHGITSKDWDSYDIMRFDNIPKFKTFLIDQPGYPFLGCGETVAGPAAAAISNALFDAIGVRMRTMPFTAQAIQDVLLSNESS